MTIFGPNNPHPLSTRKTELIWEGKYDEYGNRREVDIAGMAMPMQKIETIEEPTCNRLQLYGLHSNKFSVVAGSFHRTSTQLKSLAVDCSCTQSRKDKQLCVLKCREIISNVNH